MTGRLIDADDLKDWSEIVTLTGDGGIDINDFDEKLKSMPTVDAEPVIRCKDCIYARMTINGDSAKYCLAWQDGDALMMDSLYLPADFYCAFAERKEE